MTPLESSPNYTRLQMWNSQIADVPAAIKLWLEAVEALPAGSDQPWLCWRSLNRLCTRIGRTETMKKLWGYIDNTQSANCDCVELQKMTHPLLLDEPCATENSITITERAKACAQEVATCCMKHQRDNPTTFSSKHTPISSQTMAL